MNENLMKFIKDIGVLCEMWTVVYKSFINQGMNEKEALMHTQGFVTAILASSQGRQNET